MLRSMTGFGRSEGETGLGRISLEVRSVNHRYLDVSLRLPKRLGLFESRIKEMVRSKISRGKIDLTLRLDSSGEGKVEFSVDSSLAEQYYQALKTLKEGLGLAGEITLDLLAGAKDIITAKEESEDVEPYWNQILPILHQVLQQIVEMKGVEGESLARDIEQRLKGISLLLAEIKGQFTKSFESYRSRFHDRLRSLLEGTSVDPSRFEQEMALLAERMDITEEIVRAESHLAQLNHVLRNEEAIGRKMYFESTRLPA